MLNVLPDFGLRQRGGGASDPDPFLESHVFGLRQDRVQLILAYEQDGQAGRPIRADVRQMPNL
jgi:hypothetical protein